MKSFIILAFVLSFTISFSQNSESSVKVDSITKNNYEKIHELRLGAIKLLAGGFLDVSYEYINSQTSGYGVSLLANFENSIDYEKFGLNPYYRFYFGNNPEFKGRGFFVEVFSYFHIGEEDDFYVNQQGNGVVEDDTFFDVAPGFAVGSKWINSSGFVFQLKLGVGRNLLGNNPNEFLATGDFYIGYRF
jgi:hypothetical protein